MADKLLFAGLAACVATMLLLFLWFVVMPAMTGTGMLV